MTAYLKAMRLGRWPRSAAIFIGSAAYFFLNRSALAGSTAKDLAFRLALSFFLTWAISTANYVINEIVDAPYDIHHPTKRFRPFPSGQIRIFPFAGLGVLLTLAGLVPAWLAFSRPFFFSLLSLLAAGFIYNVKPIRTKDIPFLDAVSESANNPIRFLIGWYACAPAGLFPPLSLLCSWWAFGNFLMVAKRLSEFRLLKEKAQDYRISHKVYSTGSLLAGMTASAAAFFLTYFYFAVRHNLRPFLYLSPFLLIFFILLFRNTLKEKEVMEEPELLLKQPLFAVYTLALLLLFLLLYFL